MYSPSKTDTKKLSFRYHKKCYDSFARPVHVEAEKQSHQLKPAPDKAMQYTVREIRDNPDSTWNAAELHSLYSSTESNITRFLQSLTEHMKSEI